LFQRLQGPFEEETLKTHFEKIIFLGQKLHQTRRKVHHHTNEYRWRTRGLERLTIWNGGSRN